MAFFCALFSDVKILFDIVLGYNCIQIAGGARYVQTERLKAGSSSYAKTYAYGERLFKAMADLNQKFIMVKDLVHTQGRPGCRLTHLTPEKDALYSNAMDSINMAICALNLAQYGLHVATRIRVSTDFER